MICYNKAITDKKWKLLKSKPLIDTPWLKIRDNNYQLPNGKKAEHFYQLVRKNYVLVIVQNDQGQILVERQYRWGVDDFVLEIPAGWINDNEKPTEAATREVAEETGYILKNPELLGEIYAQPGFCTMHAFIVKADAAGITTNTPDPEEEDIKFTFMSIEKIRKLIKDGRIKDMGFISAISFL